MRTDTFTALYNLFSYELTFFLHWLLTKHHTLTFCISSLCKNLTQLDTLINCFIFLSDISLKLFSFSQHALKKQVYYLENMPYLQTLLLHLLYGKEKSPIFHKRLWFSCHWRAHILAAHPTDWVIRNWTWLQNAIFR